MTKLQKKICVVGPCLTMGGMERASSVLANAFSRKGHSVMYLAIFRHPHFFTLDNDVLFDEPREGINETHLDFLYTIRRIRSKVKQFNPDAVVAYNKLYAALTVLALTGTGYPVFISERSSPLFQWRFPLNVFMRIVFLLVSPRGVVAQTTIAANYQRKYFRKRIPFRVIPNALRTISRSMTKRENWILAVGRLSDPLKGFDRLIPAFADIQNKQWKLVFAGPDERAPQLKQQVLNLHLQERVLFMGKIDDIDSMYSQAGIFVIPSRSEGYPNALAEAMAAGLPCISFDFIAGPRDMIQHGVNGVLVEDGNTDALTNAMNELIANDEMRSKLGHEAGKMQKHLDEIVIAEQWLEFMFPTSQDSLKAI